MNAELRETIYYKAMLRNKYFRNGRNKHSWEDYRKIRNKTTKIRAKSVQNYFNKNCSSKNDENDTTFYKTIKPFISAREKTQSSSITLRESNAIVDDSHKVCNILNVYFRNVAKDRGPDDRLTEEDTMSSIVLKFQNCL